MNIGIDHGYHAIKTRNFSFPAGVTAYSHEPYTLQNTLEVDGSFFVCGTGRQPILRNKMENDSYYLLTLAAIAREIQHRNAKTECSVTIAAGLPLTSFGRDKKAFREYLFRSGQAVRFRYEGIFYRITIENVKLFPQGYSALAVHPELLRDEPSVLLMVSAILDAFGGPDTGGAVLLQELLDRIGEVGFLEAIPLWAVTLLGGLFITVLSFVMILTVYSRLFKLYLSIRGHRPYPAVRLCGGADRQYRQKLPALLCRGVFGGGGDRPLLRHLLPLRLLPARGGGRRLGGRGGLVLPGRGHFQPAGPHRRGPDERQGGEGIGGALTNHISCSKIHCSRASTCFLESVLI